MCRRLQRFWRDENGESASEYGMLIALVAIGLIAVVTIFGKSLQLWFDAKVKGFFDSAL